MKNDSELSDAVTDHLDAIAAIVHGNGGHLDYSSLVLTTAPHKLDYVTLTITFEDGAEVSIGYLNANG